MYSYTFISTCNYGESKAPPDALLNVIVFLRNSERSYECIDFTMIITSRNNAPISNYGGGFRCKSEYPWCIIEFKFLRNLSKTRKFANSLIIEVFIDDIFEDMKDNINHYDTSDIKFNKDQIKINNTLKDFPKVQLVYYNKAAPAELTCVRPDFYNDTKEIAEYYTDILKNLLENVESARINKQNKETAKQLIK
ncbi:hypothetical protein AGLY_010000 [Aphis glycines]|uniref:Uncharacterized protein n=1 Tax=Aphis glycines TaxID=307491 RepID=A0A6G0TG59_APHGL|nr:hypothetical protein AGLY_010000 [Aphis glycines]